MPEIAQEELMRLNNIEKYLGKVLGLDNSSTWNLDGIREVLKPVQRPKFEPLGGNYGIKFNNDEFTSMFNLTLRRTTFEVVVLEHKLKTFLTLDAYKYKYCPEFEYKGDGSDEAWCLFTNPHNEPFVMRANTSKSLNATYFTEEIVKQLLQDIKDGVVEIEL